MHLLQKDLRSSHEQDRLQTKVIYQPCPPRTYLKEDLYVLPDWCTFVPIGNTFVDPIILRLHYLLPWLPCWPGIHKLQHGNWRWRWWFSHQKPLSGYYHRSLDGSCNWNLHLGWRHRPAIWMIWLHCLVHIYQETGSSRKKQSSLQCMWLCWRCIRACADNYAYQWSTNWWTRISGTYSICLVKLSAFWIVNRSFPPVLAERCSRIRDTEPLRYTVSWINTLNLEIAKINGRAYSADQAKEKEDNHQINHVWRGRREKLLG